MSADIHLWRLDLEAMPELGDCDLACLDTTEQARLARFLVPGAARRFALCRLALRQVLAELGVAGGVRAAIATGAHGKPFCPEAGAPAFSISHAHRVAVIAVGSGCELGVDIEPTTSFVASRKLWATVCSDAEAAWLESHADRADAVFGELWTRKEAILKAVGIGLAWPPGRIDLSPAMDARQGWLDWAPDASPETSPLHWRQLDLAAGHVAAVATRGSASASSCVIHVAPFDAGRLPGRG